jgi:hypothetical protein
MLLRGPLYQKRSVAWSAVAAVAKVRVLLLPLDPVVVRIVCRGPHSAVVRVEQHCFCYSYHGDERIFANSVRRYTVCEATASDIGSDSGSVHYNELVRRISVPKQRQPRCTGKCTFLDTFV